MKNSITKIILYPAYIISNSGQARIVYKNYKNIFIFSKKYNLEKLYYYF